VTGNPYVVVMFGFYWVTAVVGLVNAGRSRYTENRQAGHFSSSLSLSLFRIQIFDLPAVFKGK